MESPGVEASRPGNRADRDHGGSTAGARRVSTAATPRKRPTRRESRATREGSLDGALWRSWSRREPRAARSPRTERATNDMTPPWEGRAPGRPGPGDGCARESGTEVWQVCEEGTGRTLAPVQLRAARIRSYIGGLLTEMALASSSSPGRAWVAKARIAPGWPREALPGPKRTAPTKSSGRSTSMSRTVPER